MRSSLGEKLAALAAQGPVLCASRAVPQEAAGAEVAPVPRAQLEPALRCWVALVLAVTHHCQLSHEDLLRHTGRSSKRLADARRLLTWAFLELAEGPEDLLLAWIEQCVALGRRSILDGLRTGGPPEGLAEVLQTSRRLIREMGPEDVAEAIAAGVVGERRAKAGLWSKGFLTRLGLTGLLP